VLEENINSIARYKKILITGAAGMLGIALSLQLKKYAPSSEVLALSKSDWDVTDCSKIKQLAEWLGGEDALIFHCAALVSVELCAENKTLAYDIIVNGTSNVVKLAELAGAKIVYPQSFLIYDGVETPITESTLPNPKTYYASLKLQAEKVILNHSLDHLIIRMAGFFGGEQKDKNFVGKIIPAIHQAIVEKEFFFKVGDRVWQPTYTNDLALNAILLCAKCKSGIYVMSSIGEASFWDLSHEIAKILGWLDLIKIEKVSSENFAKDEPGKRPLKAIILNERLTLEHLNIQRTWQRSLEDYLSSPYFDQFRKS
jgi:dTDP-4-dehydrorhamnose reductase